MAKRYRFPVSGDQAFYKKPLRGLMEFRVLSRAAPGTISADQVAELVSTALINGGVGVVPDNAPGLAAYVAPLDIPDLCVGVVPIVYLIVWGTATPTHQREPTPMCLWRSTTDRLGNCRADQLGELCTTLLSACLVEFIEHWKAANGVA